MTLQQKFPTSDFKDEEKFNNLILAIVDNDKIIDEKSLRSAIQHFRRRSPRRSPATREFRSCRDIAVATREFKI